MAAEAEFSMTARDKGLHGLWQQALADVKAVTGELGKLKRASQDTAKAGEEIGTLGSAGLDKFLVGLGSVTSATALVKNLLADWNAELEAIARRQRDAASLQIDLAQAQGNALLMLDTSQLSAGQFKSKIESIHGQTGGDIKDLYIAAAGVLSAAGDAPQAQALDMMGLIKKAVPNATAADLQGLAGSGLDFQKRFGVSAEDAVGGMLAGVRTSRAEDLGGWAHGTARAILSLQDMGLDFKQATAMTSTFSQRMADKESRMSGTASIQFMKQVDEATREEPELAGKSLWDRWAWLRESESERASNLRTSLLGTGKGKISGEAPSLSTMRQFLDSNSAAFGTFQNIQGLLPDITEGHTGFAAIQQARGEFGFQAANIERVGKQLTQSLQLDTGRGVAGAARKALEDVMSDMPISDVFKRATFQGGDWRTFGLAPPAWDVRQSQGMSPLENVRKTVDLAKTRLFLENPGGMSNPELRVLAEKLDQVVKAVEAQTATLAPKLDDKGVVIEGDHTKLQERRGQQVTTPALGVQRKEMMKHVR